MRSYQVIPTLALLATLVKGNGAPAYTGALLVQPGLSSAKCMTASSNVNGAPVTLQDCTGADAQKWTFTGGSVKVFGNKCLDVTDGNTANGAKLQIWGCNAGNPNQQFFYNVFDYRLSWTNKGKCVDLSSGKLTSGTPIQTWACTFENANQVWNTGYSVKSLPATSEVGQFGTNACGTTSSQTSKCQTAWINDVDDFCLWAPPTPGNIGDTEREEVAWCTKSGRGSRTIPNGVLKGVHFVKTPDYVQVTGVGDFTKMNILKGDQGGELDPHGADGNGNPIGGLVFGNAFGTGLQYHEWTSFISEGEFCFRACVGPNAQKNCQHIYDVMGCFWNMPANYNAGTFESCKGDNDLPMGIYGTSTWHQGTSPTPAPHPVASSSSCRTVPTVTVAPAPLRKRESGFVKMIAPAEATPM